MSMNTVRQDRARELIVELLRREVRELPKRLPINVTDTGVTRRVLAAELSALARDIECHDIEVVVRK